MNNEKKYFLEYFFFGQIDNRTILAKPNYNDRTVLEN